MLALRAGLHGGGRVDEIARITDALAGSVRRVHGNYHIPISNAAAGPMVMA